MTIPGYDVYRDRVPGMNRTVGPAGDIPQQTIKGTTPMFFKRLYKSPREIAILTDKTFRGGYGVLEIGTVLAVDQNDTDLLVPYTPDTIGYEDVSRVFLQNDCTTADNFYVGLLESYKLNEGDIIVLTDTDGTYEQAEISTINRTDYSQTGQALVTLTGATSNTFTVAKKGNCYVKAEDSASGKRSVAVYILDMEVDTGAGEDANGGLAAVLLQNALIYQADCPNMDSTAETDLGVTSEGIYYLV